MIGCEILVEFDLVWVGEIGGVSIVGLGIDICELFIVFGFSSG